MNTQAATSVPPISIPLCVPYLGEAKAMQWIQAAIASNYVSSVGPYVDQFEREFAAYVGAQHAVACSSGTAAIHLALIVSGVGAGDEVWAPTLSFAATINPILYLGAVPTLCDAETVTWNLDEELLCGEIARRARTGEKMPKAIVGVHLLGDLAPLSLLRATCVAHHIPLIEDAAEAVGGRYADGRHAGTLGTLGCYSFNGNKIMTTGNGGMITTDDPTLARRAKHLSTQARLPGTAYDHNEVGYNYRLSNLSAALGLAQLELLPEILSRKAAIAARYREALVHFSGIDLHEPPPWSRPTHWMYSVRVSRAETGIARDEVLHALRAAGIDSRPLWSPLHTLKPYAHLPRLFAGGAHTGSVAEVLFSEGISLPCSAGLSEADQDRVIGCLRALWQNRGLTTDQG